MQGAECHFQCWERTLLHTGHWLKSADDSLVTNNSLLSVQRFILLDRWRAYACGGWRCRLADLQQRFCVPRMLMGSLCMQAQELVARSCRDWAAAQLSRKSQAGQWRRVPHRLPDMGLQSRQGMCSFRGTNMLSWTQSECVMTHALQPAMASVMMGEARPQHQAKWWR